MALFIEAYSKENMSSVDLLTRQNITNLLIGMADEWQIGGLEDIWQLENGFDEATMKPNHSYEFKNVKFNFTIVIVNNLKKFFKFAKANVSNKAAKKITNLSSLAWYRSRVPLLCLPDDDSIERVQTGIYDISLDGTSMKNFSKMSDGTRLTFISYAIQRYFLALAVAGVVDSATALDICNRGLGNLEHDVLKALWHDLTKRMESLSLNCETNSAHKTKVGLEFLSFAKDMNITIKILTHMGNQGQNNQNSPTRSGPYAGGNNNTNGPYGQAGGNAPNPYNGGGGRKAIVKLVGGNPDSKIICFRYQTGECEGVCGYRHTKMNADDIKKSETWFGGKGQVPPWGLGAENHETAFVKAHGSSNTSASANTGSGSSSSSNSANNSTPA